MLRVNGTVGEIPLLPVTFGPPQNSWTAQASWATEHYGTQEQRYQNMPEGKFRWRKQDKIVGAAQKCIKRIIHHTQVECILGMQDWLNIWKSINIIPHINRLKKKNHMIISTDINRCRKIHFMIKTLHKLGRERRFLNLLKTTHKNPRTNITMLRNPKVYH